MANNENGNSVDYYELRRRHQAYKKNTAEPPTHGEDESVAPTPAHPEDTPFMRPAPPAEDLFEDDLPAEKAPVMYTDHENDLEEDAIDDSGASPFQSFIFAFQKIREKISERRDRHANEVLDDSDDSYDDEEPAEEKRGPFRFLRRTEEDQAQGDETENTFEAELTRAVNAPREDSFPTNRPSEEGAPPAEDLPLAENIPVAEDIPAGDDIPREEVAPNATQTDETPTESAASYAAHEQTTSDDDEDAPQDGGFKRFLNLFVVREDQSADEPIGEEDYVIDAPTGKEEFDDSLFTKPREHGASEEEHKPMGEQENNMENMTDLMADGLDDGTLSRRERRLLREHQEALAKAEESEASTEDESIDEPTREYTPVSRPQVQPAESPEETSTLFNEETQARHKSSKRDVNTAFEESKSRKRGKRDDYDDEDENDDFDEPKSRRRGRRDDFDDEDDDFDVPKSRKRGRRDDFDDEDDDFDEPKSRRRGRRDDFDDEDDDFDTPKSRRRGRRADFEEDDAPRSRDGRYDAYDDDDYDDYDDYDDAPSFGHYVLGFFKVLIAIVLILAVALFGLYFADQAVPDGVGAYDWLQKKVPVIDKILPPGEDDTASSDNALDLDTPTTSPDESAAPDATDAGTVG